MKQRSTRPLHRWHRHAGVSAAALLIYLVLTGLPLQYSGELGLGGRHVSWAPVLDWYGLEAPSTVVTSGRIAAVGDEIFTEQGHLTTLPGFLGAVATNGLLAAAGTTEVVLLTNDALEPVERLSLPHSAAGLGSWQGQPVLRTSQGILVADADLVNWHSSALSEAEVSWVRTDSLEGPAAAPFRALYRQRMLTLERALQDLHSGRFFGTAGALILDAASLLLVFLAISGLVMWGRYSTSRSRR